MKVVDTDGKVYEGTVEEIKQLFFGKKEDNEPFRFTFEEEKPAIDWDEIPIEYKYAAMDIDGRWFVYEHSPQCHDDEEWIVYNGIFDHLKYYTKRPDFDGDWRDSLVKRPD